MKVPPAREVGAGERLLPACGSRGRGATLLPAALPRQAAPPGGLRRPVSGFPGFRGGSLPSSSRPRKENLCLRRRHEKAK